MITLGLILLIIGLIAKMSILWTIGLVLIVVGLILNLVPIGGTRRRVF
ncbi:MULTISPECIES: hypothetical protein [Dermacoccus]|jgi:hypothetical protein|uniref:Uncharacterized protein n=2 Tax=Dermacoccus TaxID=57495 RepID=A0ABN2BAT4_9MICO|nr:MULTISPECIES: hypothetical protein [Dermacoccus]MBE7372230.1 hypothetical protein [Dermacoccus barathri]MBZ4497095.1 hypothetical protein [Dermacoccus sp. Tok2021]QNK53462.1 hypothetical protein H7F30_03890 [Dermacoccus sp. PAMC28757]